VNEGIKEIEESVEVGQGKENFWGRDEGEESGGVAYYRTHRNRNLCTVAKCLVIPSGLLSIGIPLPLPRNENEVKFMKERNLLQ
jgi:hypothetical protein